MAEEKDPILNPLLGPSKPTVLDPLTRKPIQSPITQDPREKMHFQTTFDQTPELQNVKEDLGEYSAYGVSMFPQLQHEWDAKRAENQSSSEKTRSKKAEETPHRTGRNKYPNYIHWSTHSRRWRAGDWLPCLNQDSR